MIIQVKVYAEINELTALFAMWDKYIVKKNSLCTILRLLVIFLMFTSAPVINFFSVSPSFWVTHFLLKMCYSKRSSWIDLTCTMNRATSPLNCLPSDTARLVEDKDIMTLFFWLSIAPVFLGLLWPSQQMMGIGLAVNSRGKSHCCLKAMVVVWAFSYVEGHRPQHCE